MAGVCRRRDIHTHTREAHTELAKRKTCIQKKSGVERRREESECQKSPNFSLTTFNEDFYMHKIILGFSAQNPAIKAKPNSIERNTEQFNGKQKLA